MSEQVDVRPVAEKESQASVAHKARDKGQHTRALAGLSWVTRCGAHSKPTGPPRKAATLAPMEKCVVCVSTPAPTAETATNAEQGA